MPADSLYSAIVCTRCRHVALLADDCDESRCAVCSADLLFLPGAKFGTHDLSLFAQLERLVYDAELSKSDAALVAADLESVSRRWEPPDLVLAQLSARLPGLSSLYDARQDYSRLLLVVGMLLTIVGARLAFDTMAPNRSLRSRSGIRELAPHVMVPEQRSARSGRRSTK
jgi:hypothetical protein